MRHLAARALGCLALATLLVAGPATDRGTAAGVGSSRPALHGTIVWPAGRMRAKPFSLRDESGKTITLASLRGRVLLVTFMYSRCKQACPIIGREVAIAQWALGPRSPLTVVVVSVAPGSDTPASVRAFAHKMRLTGTWHWLMGTRAQLAPVWARWGTYVKQTRSGISHTAALYLVDQKGYVRVADQMPLRPDWIAESVRALVRDGGR